ncbi:MAG: hypothetical protein II576_10970, partial [Prevotella sp.]|nr:hypothetical protein [Prevotella sp.]
RSASFALLSLINGILDLSKIENGKMEIIPGKYHTTELISHLENMVSDKANKKHLEFILDIDENLPKVLYGDDMRIRQVITNLLSNAVKYTEKGSVTLTVKGKDVTDSGLKLFVSVKDSFNSHCRGSGYLFNGLLYGFSLASRNTFAVFPLYSFRAELYGANFQILGLTNSFNDFMIV